MTPSRIASRRAMTLIEMLVVMAIISSLVGIVVPMAARLREAAQRASCVANLRQLTAGTLAYIGDERGRLPEGGVYNELSGGQWYTGGFKALQTYLMGVEQVNSAQSYRVTRCPSLKSGKLYNFWPGQPKDRPARMDRVQDCARRWGIPGGQLALWADPCALLASGGISGDFTTGCAHKGYRTGATSGIPAGGNCTFADGSARWLPYKGNVTIDEPAWVLNGGSIGGHIAIPNCMVWIRLDNLGNLAPASPSPPNRWDNLIVGRRNLTYESHF